MQEALLRSAANAGADIQRGVRATGISLGHPAKVDFEYNGPAETVAGRFIVAADGRNSVARRWAGFSSRADPPRLRIAGLLFEGMIGVPEDTTQMLINPDLGQSAILFRRAAAGCAHT
jgi:flavin-dependent dehydrogenase